MLESIRNPVLDMLMLAVTELGGATLFIALGMLMFWCIDKRQGFYLLTVGIIGTFLSQFLKIACRVPRPWVRDPDFTIVEAARADAAGYSFPSGHAQIAAGTYGGLAICRKETWVRIVGVALAVLIPFSRMYLGVHTPADVLFGGLCGLAMACALWLAFSRIGATPRLMIPLFAWTAALGMALLAYVYFYSFPLDLDADSYGEAVKNAWTLLGVTVGLIAAWFADKYYLHFPTAAPLWGQAVKLVVGIALLLGILAGTKQILGQLFGSAQWVNFVRYLFATLFAGVAWPMTFRMFGKQAAGKLKSDKSGLN